MAMIRFLKRQYTSISADDQFAEILTGSAWAISARVTATGMGLAASAMVARIYDAEMLGIVAVLNSFLSLAAIFALLGTNTSILRLIPEHITKYSLKSAFKVYQKIQVIVIGVSVLAGILFFFTAAEIADSIFSKPHLSFYFALAAVFVLFKSMVHLTTDAVRGLRLIRVFAFMEILPPAFNLILLLLLGVLIVQHDIPVYAQLGSYALTGIIGLAIIEYSFRKRMQKTGLVQHTSAWGILSISLPMFVTANMAFVIGQTGIVMLGMFRTDAEVGYYAIAVKIAALTAFILNAVNTITAPKFSELFSSDKIEALFHLAKKSAKLIFWTTTPILFGFLVFGSWILHIIFGNEFVVAYPALVLIVVGQFVNSISGATGLFMNMTGSQNAFKNIICIAALINIVLNLLLIPKYGINGAAFAAMICLIAWNVITLIYIKMKFGKTTGYIPLLARVQY